MTHNDTPNITQKIYAEKISKNSSVLVLLNGEGEENKQFYLYLAVPTINYAKFVEAYRKEMIRPDEWGTVIEAGYGKPSEATKQRMRDEYNFDHESQLIDPMLD